jgi:hypothetical protein
VHDTSFMTRLGASSRFFRSTPFRSVHARELESSSSSRGSAALAKSGAASWVSRRRRSRSCSSVRLSRLLTLKLTSCNSARSVRPFDRRPFSVMGLSAQFSNKTAFFRPILKAERPSHVTPLQHRQANRSRSYWSNLPNLTCSLLL